MGMGKLIPLWVDPLRLDVGNIELKLRAGRVEPPATDSQASSAWVWRGRPRRRMVAGMMARRQSFVPGKIHFLDLDRFHRAPSQQIVSRIARLPQGVWQGEPVQLVATCVAGALAAASAFLEAGSWTLLWWCRVAGKTAKVGGFRRASRWHRPGRRGCRHRGSPSDSGAR